jgi:hypothetical protein
MNTVLIALFLTANSFAYTSSPADNNKLRDPAWPSEKGEGREPASSEGKSHKQVKESKKASLTGMQLRK